MALAGILGLWASLLCAARWWTHRWLTVAAFGGFALVLIFWPVPLGLQTFIWFKILTLCFGMLLVDFVPGSRFARRPWAPWIFYALLALNIAEAAILDAVHGRWNGAAASFLLIVLLPGARAISFPFLWGRHTVAYDLPWSWIAAYTAWNAGFITGSFPAHASDHIAVLGAPVAAALFWRDRTAWARARAVTLTLHIVAIHAVEDLAKRSWLPPLPGLAVFSPYLLDGSLVLVAWCAVDRWRGRAAEPAGQVNAAGA